MSVAKGALFGGEFGDLRFEIGADINRIKKPSPDSCGMGRGRVTGKMHPLPSWMGFLRMACGGCEPREGVWGEGKAAGGGGR